MSPADRFAKLELQVRLATRWLIALEEQLDGHPERADHWTLATVRCVRHALDPRTNPIVKSIVKSQ